jgi:hypothetical protein
MDLQRENKQPITLDFQCIEKMLRPWVWQFPLEIKEKNINMMPK